MFLGEMVPGISMCNSVADSLVELTTAIRIEHSHALACIYCAALQHMIACAHQVISTLCDVL